MAICLKYSQNYIRHFILCPRSRSLVQCQKALSVSSLLVNKLREYGNSSRSVSSLNSSLWLTHSWNCYIQKSYCASYFLNQSRFARPHRQIHTSSDLFFKSRKNTRNDIEEEIDESKLSLFQKFKLMYKRYWYVLIPVHVATSVVWFGGFFLAAKNGVDIVPILESLGFKSEAVLNYLRDSNTGYYALAYAMYKVATPARYAVTLAGTTVSINYLKNRGYIKPAPNRQQLKQMYEETRDEMIEKREEMIEEIEKRSQELKGRMRKRQKDVMESIEGKEMLLLRRLRARRKELLVKFGGSTERIKRLERKIAKLQGEEVKATAERISQRKEHE